MISQDRLIFALDVPDVAQAEKYIDLLSPHVGAFKIGLELFIACGHSVIPFIDKPVMLDLKLHDIPETVERSVKAAAKLGVKFLTLHIQQRDALLRAVGATANTNLTLLGVGLLSSMDKYDCDDLGLSKFAFQSDAPEQTLRKRTTLGIESGLRGFVCPPNQVHRMRKLASSRGQNLTIVVPGIRPSGSAAQDQREVSTPRQAILDGADYLVVGRPIRDAKDPVAVANAIVSEIEIASPVGDLSK